MLILLSMFLGIIAGVLFLGLIIYLIIDWAKDKHIWKKKGDE